MRARSWFLLCVVAACGDNFHQSQDELVRVDTEPAGINCKYGGVAIETGIDTNRDGTLEDSEITSTSYVCNGAATVQCEGGNVHEGTVSVQSDADFAALAGVSCIDGDLIISSSPDAQFPALPDLSIVTGNVVVVANPDVTSLDALASLRKVGSGVVVEANQSLTSIAALGGLTTFQSMSIVGNEVLADLSGFETFTDLHNVSLGIMANPSLTSVHGLQNVTAIKTLGIDNNPALVSVADLGALRSAAVIDVSSNVALPSLELPALQTVSVRVVVNQNAELASVSLPVLTSLGESIQVDYNGALATVTTPELVLTGAYIARANASLTTISSPKLAFATLDVILNTAPGLTSVDFTNLTTIGGELQIASVPLADLSGFAKVSSLGSHLDIEACGALTDFTGLGPIARVPGNLTISGNAQLSSLAGLGMTEVGGNLTITSNPNLPLAAAQSFASGISVGGTTTIN